MSKRKSIPDVMSELQGLGTSDISLPPPTTERPALTPPATRPPLSPARSKKRTPKSRLIGRATYDIGKDLKEAIWDESVNLGVPASQLAKYLLLYAWDFYTQGEIPAPPLLPSDSPKFRANIDFEV